MTANNRIALNLWKLSAGMACFIAMLLASFIPVSLSGELSPPSTVQSSEDRDNSPFMSLKDLETDANEPATGENREAMRQKILREKTSDKKENPGLLEKSFWLGVKSWISEKNRTHPLEQPRAENAPLNR